MAWASVVVSTCGPLMLVVRNKRLTVAIKSASVWPDWLAPPVSLMTPMLAKSCAVGAVGAGVPVLSA